MDLWWVIGLIAGAGAIGGFTNAISTDNSFALPQAVKDGDNVVAWRIGIIGNMITAAVAAIVSWGLYGPSSTLLVVGSPPAGSTASPVTLSVATLTTALLIGYGGARWLTNEVDKRILKAAASAAASGAADEVKATRIANSSPAEAFRVATGRSV